MKIKPYPWLPDSRIQIESNRPGQEDELGSERAEPSQRHKLINDHTIIGRRENLL